MGILIGFLVLALYAVQAILIYGMTFGYFAGRYPSQEGHETFSAHIALVAGLLPIVGPCLVYGLSDGVKYGLRYK